MREKSSKPMSKLPYPDAVGVDVVLLDDVERRILPVLRVVDPSLARRTDHQHSRVPDRVKVVPGHRGITNKPREEDTVSVDLVKVAAVDRDLRRAVGKDRAVTDDGPVSAGWHLIGLEERGGGVGQRDVAKADVPQRGIRGAVELNHLKR